MAEGKASEPLVANANGISIPQVAFGTFELKDESGKAAIEAALKCGYRHIDCAAMYENHATVGAAIEASGVERKQLFITTKLHPTKLKSVEEDVQAYCKDLKVDYIDLLLIHWPGVKGEEGETTSKDENSKKRKELWQAMEALQKQGVVKHLGVSNFTQSHLEEVLEYCQSKPLVNQVELHPFYPQTSLVEFCRSKGILVAAYSPMGRGHPFLLKDENVLQLSKAEGVTPQALVLRWALQRGFIVTPRSKNPEHIKQNWEVQFLPPLSEGAMKQLDALAAADALEDKVMGFFGKLEELGPVGDFVPGEGGVKFNWDPATVA